MKKLERVNPACRREGQYLASQRRGLDLHDWQCTRRRKLSLLVSLLWVTGSIGFGLNLQADEKLSATSESELGEVRGIVRFQGSVPKSSVADDAGVRRDLLEVDAETRGLRHVVAHLRPVNTTVNGRRGLNAPRGAADPLLIVDQQDYAFVPRVLAVRAGEPVTFTNGDPANHNVRTSSGNPSNEFNVFTGSGGKYVHRFETTAQGRPIRLGCDIHPWMQGWIYVFDHPDFAVTDKQGAFRIGSVPVGEYQLVLKQPDIRHASERRITVSKAGSTPIEIEIRAENPLHED